MNAYWRNLAEPFADWLGEAGSLLLDARQVRHALGTISVKRGSPADIELRYIDDRFGSQDPILRMHRFVQAWTVVAADLLAGVGIHCREHEVAFAPIPSIRTALEYCCRTVWLLDNTILPEQRVARALLDELFSANETCTASSHLAGKGSEPHKQARAALRTLRLEIVRLFPEADIGDSPKTWNIGGEKFIGPTDTAIHFGTRWGDPKLWEGTYDALSTMTHPGAGVLEFFEGGPDGEAVVSTDKETVRRLLLMAILPYYQAVRHLLAYNQWPSEPFDAWESRVKCMFPGIISEPEITN